MKPAVLLAVVGCGLLVRTANADDLANATTRGLVAAFDAICVKAIPNLDRVEDTAAAMGLKETTGSDPAIPAAPGPHTLFKTWRILGANNVAFPLSITGGQENGKTVSVCAVLSRQAEADPAESALKEALQLGRAFRTDTSGGQRYLDWNKTIDGRTVIVSAVDATPSGTAGVSFATTVISK